MLDEYTCEHVNVWLINFPDNLAMIWFINVHIYSSILKQLIRASLFYIFCIQGFRLRHCYSTFT